MTLDRNSPDITALTDALLESQPPERILKMAAAVVRNPMALIDSGFHMLAWSDYDNVPDDTWHKRIDEGYWDYDFVTMVRQFTEKSGASARSAIVTGLSQRRRRIDILSVNGALLGYSVVLELETKLEDIDEPNYAYVRQILSRVLVAERAYYLHRGQEGSSIMLRDLLGMRFPNKVLFRERIRGSEFDRDTVFQLFSLWLDAYAPEKLGGEKLKAAVKRLFPHSWSAYDNDHIIVLIDHTATFKDTPNAMQEFESFLHENGLIAGQSTLFSDLGDLPQQREQATTALDILRDMRPLFLFTKDAVLAPYERCKLLDMLGRLPKDSLPGFCHTDIKALADYDREHKSEYLRTVFAYLDAERSVHEAAKKLFVHHNTVNYRMSKAKELFHLDFTTEYRNLHYYLSCIILLYYS